MASSKKCSVCDKEIPEEYQNLLCMDCYLKEEKDRERLKKEADEELKASGRLTPEETNKQNAEPHVPIDPNYKCNPMQDEIDLVQRNYVQFEKTGKWLWGATRDMYTFIRDSFRDIVVAHPQYPKFVWKPTVCDVGCGSGCGTNVLSQEADFTWGIDKCEKSVKFATELFARQKNNIYYTPEIRFDVIDVTDPPPNIDMKFDVITCLEVFEHLEDHDALLELLKHMCHPAVMGRKSGLEALPATYVWISTPNRQNKNISNVRPKNKYHVKELTQEEFESVLKGHFKEVSFFNSKGDPVGDNNTHTPLLALCRQPL